MESFAHFFVLLYDQAFVCFATTWQLTETVAYMPITFVAMFGHVQTLLKRCYQAYGCLYFTVHCRNSLL